MGRTIAAWSSLVAMVCIAAGALAQGPKPAAERARPALLVATPEPSLSPEKADTLAGVAVAQGSEATAEPAPLPRDSGTPVPARPGPAPAAEAAPASDPCTACGRGPRGRRTTLRGEWWTDRIKPCLQESHWGYADQFEAAPLGASVQAHLKVQVCNGLAGQMVLYRYDFGVGPVSTAALLNPHGRKRLDEIVRIMQDHGLHPLVIEPTGNEKLDAARRDRVLKLMAQTSFAVPEEWVVVAEPRSRGRDGVEALLDYQSLLRQTQSQGGASAGAGGGRGTQPATPQNTTR